MRACSYAYLLYLLPSLANADSGWGIPLRLHESFVIEVSSVRPMFRRILAVPYLGSSLHYLIFYIYTLSFRRDQHLRHVPHLRFNGGSPGHVINIDALRHVY